LCAGLLADLIVAEPELGRHALEGERKLDGVEVLALDVFDDGEFENLLIVSGADDDRNVLEPHQLGRAPAAFSGDELIFPLRSFPDDYGLNDAFALDGLGELQQSGFIEIPA